MHGQGGRGSRARALLTLLRVERPPLGPLVDHRLLEDEAAFVADQLTPLVVAREMVRPAIRAPGCADDVPRFSVHLLASRGVGLLRRRLGDRHLTRLGSAGRGDVLGGRVAHGSLPRRRASTYSDSPRRASPSSAETTRRGRTLMYGRSTGPNTRTTRPRKCPLVSATKVPSGAISGPCARTVSEPVGVTARTVPTSRGVEWGRTGGKWYKQLAIGI